ncbi:interleukin-17 receptor A-like [Pristis pectinata]|uniref:interleukin-17 receptor A-like n=1 Tax=Pristis pectinata TaxID=685728 RepID=UPI00223D2F50|nr:interleukin-17 receptor A-like [Pristis pectinata]
MRRLLTVNRVVRELQRVFIIVLSLPVLEGSHYLGDCSQQGLNCTVLSGNCLDSSWFKSSVWTPSFPKDLRVTITRQGNASGFHKPVLSISWKLRTDASINYSQGIEISLAKWSTGERKCIQYRFNNRITSQVNPQGKKWAFLLERFEVDPDQKYTVTACSLPRANINQDNDCPKVNYTVPGCSDDSIKYTEVCKRRGSLWNPDITYIRSEMNVTIIFQTGNYSSKYIVLLQSRDSNKICNHAKKTFDEVVEQRVNVTFSTENWMQSCTAYEIKIIPFFEGCHHDCKQVIVFVPEPATTQMTMTTTTTKLTSSTPAERTHFFAGICVIILMIVFGCTIWVQIKSKPNEIMKLPEKPSHVVHQGFPQVQKKVLIIYSLDHNLYQNVVLAFAQFLMTACGTKVTLDCLQSNEAAEIGHMNWLTLHKNESDKIIILCSRGTRAKWEAMLSMKQRKILLKSEERSPMHDMFTPAMNLILPDFKRPASFGKYIVAYFDDISSEDDIPDPFNVAVKYKLMKQFEEIHFRVQDLEKYEPGKTFHVAGIALDDYHKCPSGEILKNALEKFKLLQMEQPDWFEKECITSPEEAGMEEESSFDFSAIDQNVLQYQPFGVPCTVNEVCMAKSNDETFVQYPVGFEDAVQDMGLSQNVIGIDCSEAQVLNPIRTLEPLYRISTLDCSQTVLNYPNFESPPKAEGSLKLEKDCMMQNDIRTVPQYTCESNITVNEAVMDSGGEQISGISDDVKRRLQDLQQMLLLRDFMSSVDSASEVAGYPQSLSLLEKKENTDSDQGYSSQQSVDEIPLGSVSISSDVLNDLKMLQMALLNESMGMTE